MWLDWVHLDNLGYSLLSRPLTLILICQIPKGNIFTAFRGRAWASLGVHYSAYHGPSADLWVRSAPPDGLRASAAGLWRAYRRVSCPKLRRAVSGSSVSAQWMEALQSIKLYFHQFILITPLERSKTLC